MTLKSSTNIGAIMDQAATTIFPARDVNELTLTYKGKDITKEKMKTLKQVMGSQFGKVDACKMILSSKSDIELEYE